jgi:CheY-like chemotaxis protein
MNKYMPVNNSPTILIAEDDTVLRDAYVMILLHAGFKVHEAEDGRQALKKVISCKPDLLILDMLMPGKTGLEVLRDPIMKHLRPKLKVIAFTNLSDPETIDALVALNVDKYLLKASVMPQMLIDTVNAVLSETH